MRHALTERLRTQSVRGLRASHAVEPGDRHAPMKRERAADNANTVHEPPYTLVDAVATYKSLRWLGLTLPGRDSTDADCACLQWRHAVSSSVVMTVRSVTIVPRSWRTRPSAYCQTSRLPRSPC